MLGPLDITKAEKIAPSPEPILVGEPGRPGQQLPSRIFLPRDPAGEAEEREAHAKAMLRKFCPEVADAGETRDAARAHHDECLHKWEAANEALMQAQSALNRCGPDAPHGDRDDLRSNVVIRAGFEQVARFNLEAAADVLRKAINNLAAVNRAQSERAAKAR